MEKTYDFGTEVELTAIPDPDNEFSQWSGDISGNENPECIIMDGSKEVTAKFKTSGPGPGDPI